ncbi:MAG TPA: O-antigen ligase family protein [Alloacidobacterium sp.]|nr:O-antigen ligase family protein [Alloacidobacterium sp.]
MANPRTLIFFIPALFSLYFVIRGNPEKAFLRVYLPALLGLPYYFACALPHMPAISISEAAVIPIVVGSLLLYSSRWTFSRLDIWVVLYLLSFAASEVLRETRVTDGYFNIFTATVSILFPYMVGKLLIEPHLRLPAVKMFVVVILVVGAAGLYELRMGLNPFTLLQRYLVGYSNGPWSLQFRNGRARVAVSFSDAELAGIAFTITLALNWWLFEIGKLHRFHADKLGAKFSWLERRHIPGLILIALILLTQSRGPMLGAILAFVIIQIPRFKNVRRAMMVTACLLAVGAAALYTYFDHYTASAINNTTASEQAQSASYRRLLLDNYAPIAEEGGWLGWGINSRPIVAGQRSIDNEFLLLHVTQGRLGLILFALIVIETLWHLLRLTWQFKAREDLYFAFCMLAAMAALWATITTVYLGEQLPQVAFLLAGWGQALKEQSGTQIQAVTSDKHPRFSFKRIFT